MKGIGILLVVVGHSGINVDIKIFIYFFHMPLFFIISGFLYKKNIETATDECRYMKKCAYRYLIPYFILCLINLVLDFTCCKVGINQNFSLIRYIGGILYSRGTVLYMPNCSPLWFLTCLFCTMLLFSVLRLVKRPYCRVLLVIFCVVISSMLDFLNAPKLLWNIDTALMAVIFVETGYAFRQKNVISKVVHLQLRFLIPLLICLLMLGTLFIHFNPIGTVSFDENSYGNPVIMIIGAIVISYLVFLLSGKISEGNNPLRKILSFFGQHTVFIMGFDYFFGNISRILLQYAGITHWTTQFVLKLLLLTAGILIWTWMVNRIPNSRVKHILIF